MNQIRPRLITLLTNLDSYIVTQNAKIVSGVYNPSLTAYYTAEVAAITSARTTLITALNTSLPS